MTMPNVMIPIAVQRSACVDRKGLVRRVSKEWSTSVNGRGVARGCGFTGATGAGSSHCVVVALGEGAGK